MRVGTIGDLHLPFTHPMYLRFCLDTFEAWRVDEVVFIGDIVDLHGLSFWEHDPNGMSAGDESELAAIGVEQWHAAFSFAKPHHAEPAEGLNNHPRTGKRKRRVCIGNHDERHYRVARRAGLPDRYLRTYAEVWRTPQWDWRFSHKLDGVNYEHGTGTHGKDGAINLAIQKRTSTVIGHIHSWAGVKYHANSDSIIFGMNAGCGIDIRAYAFAYGKSFPVRPVLGCGIVVDGESAIFEPMPIGRGETYHRSRAGRLRRPFKFIRSR